MHSVYVWVETAFSKIEYTGMEVYMNIVYTFTFIPAVSYLTGMIQFVPI